MLKVEGITTINNYECYHITAKVIPNRFFQHFYDLEYKVHSYIDKQLYYTRRFEKIRRMNKQYNRLEFKLETALGPISARIKNLPK